MSIGAQESWFWANLCRVLGREDYIPYQEPEGGKKEEVFSVLGQIFRSKTRDEWTKILGDMDVCATPVYELEEIFTDPQILHRQMLVEVKDPQGNRIKQVGIAVKLSETPGSIRRFAPMRGQHTDEVVQALGYSAQGIERLKKAGVIA